MQHAAAIPWIILVALSSGQVFGADVGAEHYFLPLVAPYAVHREDSRSATADQERYALVEMQVSPSKSVLSHPVIPDIEQVAVSGQIIIGKARKGYFLLDASKPEPEPRLVKTMEEWRSALSAAGIASVPQLSDPDALASAMPDVILRPWNYRMMNGLLGQSDDAWAGILQSVGLAGAFMVGLLRRPKGSLVAFSVLTGIVVNVIAQMVIAGGGPEAFVGFFMLPVIFCIAAYLGRLLRRLCSPREADTDRLKA